MVIPFAPGYPRSEVHYPIKYPLASQSRRLETRLPVPEVEACPVPCL